MQKQKKAGSFLKRSTSVSPAQQVFKDNTKEKRERFFSLSETNYDSVISGSSEEELFDDVVEDDDSEINTFHSLTEWNEFVSRQQIKELKVYSSALICKSKSTHTSESAHSRPWTSQPV